jgi:ABC-2 type transport system ATP-binding protein
MTDLAIQTERLGKRYRSVWALHDCSIEVPTGRVSGLVGANGAGKTTLMRLLAGVSSPTTGHAVVGGREPADDPEFLRQIGYLAQEVPLYRRWNAEDHLALGAHMNDVWDDVLTRERLLSLRIPLDRPMSALSGGMRAQVALALALGKRPRILLLDEPVAALDPLARRQFLGSLTAAVAEGDLTVLLSSHLLADLERVCDHLILMAGAQPVICAEIDDLVASHKLLTAGARDTTPIRRQHQIISESRTRREVALTVKLDGPVLDPAWEVHDLGLEEIVLAYLEQNLEQNLEQDHPSSPPLVGELR